VIKAAIKNGYVFQVGQGKNIWSVVHIEDLVDLYNLVLDGLLSNKVTNLGPHGYHFAENGELEWRVINQKIAEVGFNRGILSTPTVKSGLSDEEVKEGLGTTDARYFVGSNSRCRAEKARKLGWKPKYTQEKVFEYIEQVYEDFTFMRERG
jgi:nucleoside-diphosphate-sugar epimerase